ncbi:MAG: hypothetical protein V3T23_11260 [Nitrososphaerales archaeon]
MTKEELIRKLVEWSDKEGDTESQHVWADNALLDYIDDDSIRKAYKAISKWYA